MNLKQLNSDSLELCGKVSQYIIYKKFSVEKGATFNQFYLVYRHDNPKKQTDLLMIKVYVNIEGYFIEKKVFDASGLYSHLFLASCDEFINHKGNKLCYTVLKKMKNGSLIQFLSLVKTLPLEPARFFLKSIFQQLQTVYQKVEVHHQTLHNSDILVDEQMKPIVVGWSKIEETISERELIYDCADIFHTLILGSPIPLRAPATKAKKNGKNRFLDKKDWQNFKKRITSKKFTQDETTYLLQFFSTCIIKDSQNQCSIHKILSTKFLSEKFNEQQILDQISGLQTKKSEQKKNKSIERMDKKIKRLANIQQYQSQRSDQDRDLIHEFHSFYTDSLKEIDSLEEEDYKKTEDLEDLKKSISKESESSEKASINKLAALIAHLHILFVEGIGKGLVFDEDTARLHKFKIDHLLDEYQNEDQRAIKLQLNFEIFNEQTPFRMIEAKIQLDKEQLVNIELQGSQVHEFYLSNLRLLLKEQIEFILG